MRLATVEMLPHVRRKVEGGYVVLVGRIIDFKDYPNIGVIFAKTGDIKDLVFVIFPKQGDMRYVENKDDVDALKAFWELAKQEESKKIRREGGETC